MKTLARQRGMGLFQWVAVLAIAGFFLLFAFKIVPLYAENRYVIAALRALEDDGSKVSDMSDAEIRKKLANFYLINNVRSEGPTQNIQIERTDQKAIIMIDYETRVNFIYNIDLVLKFQNHLDSSQVNLCCAPLPADANRSSD